MKDRYLFKAKTARIVDTYNNAEDGVWVKGSLKEDCGKYTIFQFEFDRADYVSYEVDPDTICQCTGRTDRDKTLVFEHDVVVYLETYSTESGYAEVHCVGEVVWDDETISFQVTNRLSAESYEVLGDECSVVGNTFDNSDLLEE